MIPEEQQDQAALYSLGLLDAEETRAMDQAMATSPELRNLVSELRETAAMMAFSSEAKTPPAALRQTIIQQVKVAGETRAPAPYLGWIPWAIAASLLAASVLLLSSRSQLSRTVGELQGRLSTLAAERDSAVAAAAEERQKMELAGAQIGSLTRERNALNKKIAQLQEENESSRVEAAKLTADRNALQEKAVALERNANILIATLSSKLNNAPSALATIIWDGAKQQGVLRTTDVPATATDRDYQLWIADPRYKTPVDGGVFSVDQSGKAEIVFRPKLRITSATAFLVSLERKGGVPTPAGPIVLAAKL